MFEKLDMKTINFTDENIKKLAEIFPNVVSEDENGKVIDFEALKQELSENIVEGYKERYSLNWPGKREAQLKANNPTTKTLRPCIEDSVNFDTTENLYIEGDNLEVLKILQEGYLNKIKMIYIDPPYNTGKDFVYKDNFTRDSKEELLESGQIDEEGGKLVANPETNGRYHSDWLSMMYPRLKLARNLLKENGIIFISIDSNEITNLRKICDEIFGESNFISEIIWLKGKEGGNDNDGMGEHHEYIVMYGKSDLSKKTIKLDPKDTSRHITKLPEDNLVIENIKPIYKEGEPFQLVNLSKQKDYDLKIPLKDGSIIEWEGYCPQSTIDEYIKIGKVFVGEKKVPYIKSFLSDEKAGTKPSTIFEQSIGTTKSGGIEIKNIFDNQKIFSYPKPSSLIYRLIDITCENGDTVLDFFSGSSSSAHATLTYQKNKNISLKFIMVQLNEKIDISNGKNEKEKKNIKMSIDFLSKINKPPFITEIGKERIRRVGKKIVEESGKTDLDIGFRVLKLDDSNMKDIYFTPQELGQSQIDYSVDNIKEDRSDLDLLFGVLIDWGVDLTLPIKKEIIQEKNCYFVDNDSLCAYFGSDIDEEFIKELAKKEALRFVFKDSSFGNNDDLKDNVSQIFKQLNPSAEIKVI